MLLVLLGAFGTLGVGAGFALGAKLCRPDAEVSQSLEAGGLLLFWTVNNPKLCPVPPQVWCLFGDGAFGYSLIEFDTFVRHKVTGCPW